MIKKAIIPAAGSGTRLGPFTDAIPKELLPVGDKAIIEHVVEAFELTEVDEIAIVVSPRKHGLSDYLGSGKKFGMHFSYVVQDERLGLANAVLAGEHVIKNHQFAVVLGDNFFRPTDFLRDLIVFHEEEHADATIGVAKVEDVTRHGIIKVEGDAVVDLIEKPRPEEAPSNLGAIGIYAFKPILFDAIRETKPGYKGEYQLTDSLKILVEWGKRVRYKEIPGVHIDVGTVKDLVRANEYYLNDRGKRR
ncbi:MAG: NTP transferase domain-containing protein [Thermoplasmatales archaeon]|nr:NTP transferase domain-containing protein [Thermoplasmatales archaeon]